MTCRIIRRRSGFTVVELATAMIGAAALLGGMSAAIFMAVRASNPNGTPAASVSETSRCLAEISNELQFAVAFPEATSSAFSVTLPDRTGDGNTTPETIRYGWTGAGAPLTRQYNGGAVQTLLPSVQSLALEFYPAPVAAQSLTVRIQRSVNSRTTVECSIPLLNRP